MRFVLCDSDPLMRTMIEALVDRQGHEVIGAADTTADASELIVHGRPEAAIIDLSLGYNTDFDIIDVSMAVGARVIVFSHNANHEVLDRYTPRPLVVPKPDFVDLEAAIDRLTTADFGPTHLERRVRPSRVAMGPTPTGLGDAQAFYEALANADADDVLVSVEPSGEAGPHLAEADARRVQDLVRSTDRVLAAGPIIRVFLAGADSVGLQAFTRRLRREAPSLADAVLLRAIVISNGESSAEAFDRLKSATGYHP